MKARLAPVKKAAANARIRQKAQYGRPPPTTTMRRRTASLSSVYDLIGSCPPKKKPWRQSLQPF
ncbi:hypothetical protein J6590_032590 [Homalodisca vitripennis]|nr:hypothetical protein J6590_032590 [Homalodisca vitripennis]